MSGEHPGKPLTGRRYSGIIQPPLSRGPMEREEDGVPTKKSVLDLHQMKARGEKITWLTGYDYPTALFEEQAGVDMILVGDSLGMCVYGYPGTVPVTHGPVHRPLRGGAPRRAQHLRDRRHALHELPGLRRGGGAQRRPLPARRRRSTPSSSRAACASSPASGRSSTPASSVCGHIGLTPQSSGQLGGHKAQGRTLESAKLVIEDARAIAAAGAQLLLLEAVPPEVAGFIRAELAIPVLGIGAGEDVDGQLLIVSDVLGEFQAFTPKFVKKYADIAAVSVAALSEYVGRRARRPLPRRAALLPHAGRRGREVRRLDQGEPMSTAPTPSNDGSDRRVLRERLRIQADDLDVVNAFLTSRHSALLDGLLDLVERYGGVDEINRKADEAGRLETRLERLRDEGSPYLADLEWLIEQRDAGAFVTLPEYRELRPRRRGRREAHRRGARRHPGDQRPAVLPLAHRRGQAGHPPA